MDWLFDLDRAMFEPNVSLLEMFLRGSIMYLGLFVLMRVVLKRESGSVGVPDILVIVLIADAAQNGMSGDYLSIPEGFVLVMTILGWAYAVDWLTFHVPLVARLVDQPPLPLVRDGRILYRNLRRELITRDELESQLRQQGAEDVSEVRMACMESDGRISVIKTSGDVNPAPRKRGAPA
jgi:uncharacterized membrane protein YcaP (DUF421 family)